MTFPEYRLGQRPGNAGRRFPPEPLTRAEARSLLEVFGAGRRPRFVGERDQALGVVLYRAGLRISEALDLFEKDIDGELIHVLHGKGDRQRIVPIDPQGAEIVHDWIGRRRELGLNGEHPLFCTLYQPLPGARQWDTVVREKLKDAGVRAEIARRVHPHGLRHTYAKELAEEGVPVHVIRQLLGHQDLATTERYIRKLYPAELARYIRERRWDTPTHRGASSGSGPLPGTDARRHGPPPATA